MPAATHVASGSTAESSDRRKSKIERRAGIALGTPSTNCTCGRSLTQTFFHQVGGVVQHREIEHLDLRLDTVVEHCSRETFDEVRRVLVNAVRKVDRAGRQRRHVGLQVQHRATLLLARGRGRRWRTARSCRGSACARLPARGRTARDRSPAIHPGCERGCERAQRRPRMPGASTRSAASGVTGTAGLSFLRGTAPVIATVMMTGLVVLPLILSFLVVRRPSHYCPTFLRRAKMSKAPAFNLSARTYCGDSVWLTST